jgi:V8-like Glu-specific endopeptidase
MAIAARGMALLLLCGLTFPVNAMSDVVPQTQPIWPSPGMSIVYGFEWVIGTGAMIGNKTVLTAAHVIYDPSLGWPDSITFIPALNGTNAPYSQISATRYYVPSEWIRGDQDYDLGVFVLDSEVGKQTGFLQLAVESDSFFTNQPLTSAGLQGKMILHLITTEEGQSGAPVWFEASSVPTVVGLNIGWEEITNSDGSVVDNGLATRIDEDFGARINETLSQNGDQTQPNLPTPTSDGPKLTSNVSQGLCGIGAGQALLVLSLSWGLFFIRRSARF